MLDALDGVVGRFQMDVGNQHHIDLEAGFQRMDVLALFIEQEGGDFHRHLGDGARRYVVREFSAIGTNLVIVLPGRTESMEKMQDPLRRNLPGNGAHAPLAIDVDHQLGAALTDQLQVAPPALPTFQHIEHDAGVSTPPPLFLLFGKGETIQQAGLQADQVSVFARALENPSVLEAVASDAP